MSRLGMGGGALAVTVFVIAVLAQAAGAVVAPKADYRFHDNLSSSVPGAPALTDLGTGNGFATENVAGCMTRVQTFPMGNGLVLDASGFRPGPPFSQTIVIDFRLSDVSGYRRLIQTADGTSDTGLYIHDGDLVWYEGGLHSTPTTTIAPNQFVEVTLLQNAILSMFSMSAFVNGVEQASFTLTAVELGPQIRLLQGQRSAGSRGGLLGSRLPGPLLRPSGFFSGDAQTVYADSLLGNPSSCPGAGASATGKPRALKNSYGGVVVDTGSSRAARTPPSSATAAPRSPARGRSARRRGRPWRPRLINVSPGTSQSVTLVLGKRGQEAAPEARQAEDHRHSLRSPGRMASPRRSVHTARSGSPGLTARTGRPVGLALRANIAFT